MFPRDEKREFGLLSHTSTKAVKQFRETRFGQTKKQQDAGRTDQGARSAVTGGKQMDGFVLLVREIITSAGRARISGLDKVFPLFCLYLVGTVASKMNQALSQIEQIEQIGPFHRVVGSID